MKLFASDVVTEIWSWYLEHGQVFNVVEPFNPLFFEAIPYFLVPSHILFPYVLYRRMVR